MTTEPAGREDLAGLKERLIAPIYITVRNGGQWVTISSPFKDLVREEAHAAIIKLEQENAKLREALTPFAEMLRSEWPDKDPQFMCFRLLRVADFRHAAEALRADVKEG